jgi:hypothetical protein
VRSDRKGSSNVSKTNAQEDGKRQNGRSCHCWFFIVIWGQPFCLSYVGHASPASTWHQRDRHLSLGMRNRHLLTNWTSQSALSGGTPDRSDADRDAYAKRVPVRRWGRLRQISDCGSMRKSRSLRSVTERQLLTHDGSTSVTYGTTAAQTDTPFSRHQYDGIHRLLVTTRAALVRCDRSRSIGLLSKYGRLSRHVRPHGCLRQSISLLTEVHMRAHDKITWP